MIGLYFYFTLPLKLCLLPRFLSFDRLFGYEGFSKCLEIRKTFYIDVTIINQMKTSIIAYL